MNAEKFEEKLNKNEELAARAERQRRQRDAESSMCTDRGIWQYEYTLEIPITEKFLGKTVLDLGSGMEGQFARAAARRGIDVYSLSGALGSERFRKILRKECIKNREERRALNRSVGGLAQELPFKSNVFDSVLSVWAVPAHIPPDKKNYIESFKEIVRVLKPGGRAFLAPILRTYDFDLVERAINKIKKEQPIKNKFKEGRRGTILILTKSDTEHFDGTTTE